MAVFDPLNGRTLPGSGQLDMWSIDNEFRGRGLDFNSYRNTRWYTDAGASGLFSGDQLNISDFRGKRFDLPIPPAGPGDTIVVGGNTTQFSGLLSTGTPHPMRVIVCTVTSGDSTSNMVNSATIDGTPMTLALKNSGTGSMRSTAIYYISWPSGTEATFRPVFAGASASCLLASYPIYPRNPAPISTAKDITANTSVVLTPLTTVNGGYGFVTSHHRNLNPTRWVNTLGVTVTDVYNDTFGGVNGATARFRTIDASGDLTASWVGANNGSAVAAIWGP